MINRDLMSIPVENEEGKPRVLRLPLALLVIGLVYIFSVGPVLTTAERFKLGATRFYRPLRAFYSPVFVVARSSGFGTRAYESYVGFWSRMILKHDYQRYSPGVPIEGLISSIGSITNGQSSFQIHVPSKLSRAGSPTSQDVAMSLIIDKVREHNLYPAGFQQQPGGRIYTFEREREWERKRR